MSNIGEVQFIYAPQTHIINTPFQKQQPTSKLVNRYLSTAAQYLNRTKSFHVPSTNNNNSICQYTSPTNLVTNNLAQSMHSISPLTTVQVSSNDLQMSTNENNSSSLPLNCNNNSINSNKSQGFVNTLRRSLRKNRERFYNKRSATMKSCHSLNTYEQTPNDQQNTHVKVSMTPSLHYRRQQSENKNGTYSLRKTIMKDNNKNDQMRKRKMRSENFIFRNRKYFLQPLHTL